MSMKKYKLTLLLLALLSALIRLPALFQELPPFLFCDEGMFYGQVNEMLSTRSWLPTDFRSGGLNIYPVLLLIKVMQFFAPVFGEPTSVLIAGRFILTVCLGSLGLVTVALATEKFTSSRITAIFAGVLYVVSPGLRAFGRYWYPDHYIYALSGLTLLALASYLAHSPRSKARDRLHALGLGVAIGLTFSTKFSGLFLLIPAGIAVLIKQLNPEVSGLKRSVVHICRDSLLVLAGLFTSFLLINPGVIFRWDDFVRDWKFNLANYGKTSNGIQGVLVHAEHLFVRSLTTTGLLLVAIGIWSLLSKRAPTAGLLFSFPAFLVIYLGRTGLAINRNVAIAIPFLIVIASMGLTRLLENRLYDQGSRRRGARFAIASVFLLWPALETSASVIHDLSPDSRLIAQDWIRKNIPLNVTVGINEFCSGPPPIDRSDLQIVPDPQMTQNLDYYVLNSYWSSPFSNAYESVGEQKYFHFYRFNDLNLFQYRNSSPQLEKFVPRGFQLVEVFSSNGPDIIVLRRLP